MLCDAILRRPQCLTQFLLTYCLLRHLNVSLVSPLCIAFLSLFLTPWDSTFTSDNTCWPLTPLLQTCGIKFQYPIYQWSILVPNFAAFDWSTSCTCQEAEGTFRPYHDFNSSNASCPIILQQQHHLPVGSRLHGVWGDLNVGSLTLTSITIRIVL